MALNRNEVGLQFSLSVDFADAVRQLQVFQSRFRDMGADVQGQIRQMQASMASFGRTAQQTGQQLGDSFQEPFERVRRSTSSLQDAFTNLGNVLSVGVTLPLAGLSAAAIKSAVDLDKSRARLAALTGSAEEANRVISELNKLVERTPGLTSAFAMDAYAQMRALGTIGEESIMRLTASLGRLNAVFTLQDPAQFARNLTQIFTQSFERADIKEALGQVPIFEQLLEQAFGTKDAAKLRQLKEAGALTSDVYFQGIIEAIERNPAIANAQETIAGRFAKLTTQLQSALVPLGERLLNAIIPAVERLAPILIGLLDSFSKMPPALQNTVIAGGAFLAFIGPAIRLTAELRTAFSSLMVILTAGAGGGLIGAIGRLSLAIKGLALSNPITASVVAAVTVIGTALAYINSQLDGLELKVKGFATALLALGGTGASIFTLIARVAERRRNPLPESGDPELRTDEELAGSDADTVRKRLEAQLKATVDGQKKLTQRTIDYEKLVRDIVSESGRQQLRLFEVQTQGQLNALKRRYDAEEISQREFGEQTLRLQMEQAKREMALLGDQRARLEGDLARTRNTEKRLQLERELVQVTGEQAIKLVEIGGLLDARAQRGALPLFTIDPAQVEQALDMVEPLIEDFRTRQQARLDQITGLDTQAIRTRTEIIAIENQLELRQISRTEAQERINELLRQERDQRIASLQVQMQALDITEEQSAKLAQQIELLRTQGETARAIGFGDVLQGVFDSIRQPAAMLGDAINGIRAGAEQMVETLVLTGQLSGQAFLKMARGAIAAMAAEAAVAAIMETARGLSKLALGLPVQAAQHFASAKTFAMTALKAGVATAALGAIAPGGASESGGTGGRFVTGTAGRPETISLIQGQQGARREPQVIIIRAETEPGVVVRKVVENIQNNGEMRQIIKQEIMQGAF
jgi:hypothetical protein